MSQLKSPKGGGKASRKYFECHNKDKQENGKNQLLRKKNFWEEKSLSLKSTLIIQGISLGTNNRLNIGTSGDISSSQSNNLNASRPYRKSYFVRITII